MKKYNWLFSHFFSSFVHGYCRLLRWTSLSLRRRKWKRWNWKLSVFYISILGDLIFKCKTIKKTTQNEKNKRKRFDWNAQQCVNWQGQCRSVRVGACTSCKCEIHVCCLIDYFVARFSLSFIPIDIARRGRNRPIWGVISRWTLNKNR
jgi:hypothetical protein